ncbi:MAG: hypothetical protein NTZ13_00515 [Candidatus Parcubacteria bacterium]|nr:hypothetical protein [Candidatus Parcubacteria bacterium]
MSDKIVPQEKTFCWLFEETGKEYPMISRVYLWEKNIGISRVLRGNLKNMNPHHTIGSGYDPDLFDAEPTDEDIAAYVANYGKEPCNPETGKPWSVYFEVVSTDNLKTDEEALSFLFISQKL